MRAGRLAAALVAGSLFLSACTGPDAPGPGPASAPSQATPVLDPEVVAEQVAALPQVEGTDLKAERLADGLVPPTNRWFSGLVFGDAPQPVFPLPYAFALTEDGFGLGLPQVVTTEKTIMGSNAPDVAVALPGAPDWQVTAYDAATVTVTDAASGGSVVVAQGSPYVSFTAADAVRLDTPGLAWTADGDRWTTTAGKGTPYVLVGEGLTVSGSSVEVPAGGHATWFAVPEGGDAAALAERAQPVTGSTLAHTIAGDKATTTLAYATAGGAPTALAAMPHQVAGRVGEDCTLGTYPSVYGELQVCAGNELTFAAPLQEAATGLDLGGLSGEQADALRAQLTRDVAALPDYPADTYFGGKALYRDAQLWDIARQLGADTEADALRARLVETMDRWMDPARCADVDAFCFTYDTANRGLVGRTPSFGSEEFNDHHFHYGYFLYAGGVLAAEDPELAERWAPVMDLLAADIASSTTSDLFPALRTFDAYASHSWASGTSPFADGNNQESSSEAVHAWAGLTLWARARGNAPLEEQARWLHAMEGASARAYWTDFDRSAPVYDGFGHTISPLNFGGKRDYATWFSAEPAAAMAILVIPGSPSSGHLAGDPERIRANVAEATATRGFDQQYGDYLLMYSALAGPDDARTALEVAQTVSDEAIDDGSTRTYLLAFLMAAAD